MLIIRHRDIPVIIPIYLWLILFCLMFLSACFPAPIDRAQYVIEKYFETNLVSGDKKQIYWGKLRNIESKYEFTSEGKKAINHITELENKLDSSEANSGSGAQIYSQLNKAKIDLVIAYDNFLPQTIGYEMFVDYYAKNPKGQMEVNRKLFVMDSEFKIMDILDSSKIEENNVEQEMSRYRKYYL